MGAFRVVMSSLLNVWYPKQKKNRKEKKERKKGLIPFIS